MCHSNPLLAPWVLWHFCISAFLKVLIVLTTAPGTTPLETMLDKEPVTQVALLQLIIKCAVTVNVSAGGCRLDEEGAIGPTLDIRVIEGIDVDRHATAMSRHMTAASYAAILEKFR